MPRPGWVTLILFEFCVKSQGAKIENVICIMVIWVVEFSSGGYKIRKIFAYNSTYPENIVEF